MEEIKKIKTQEIKVASFLREKREKEYNKIRVNVRILNVVIWTIVLLLGVSYIATINDLAVKGFALKELKQELADLNDANLSLNVKSAALKSYAGMDEKIASLGLVPANRINYIEKDDGLVAKK